MKRFLDARRLLLVLPLLAALLAGAYLLTNGAKDGAQCVGATANAGKGLRGEAWPGTEAGADSKYRRPRAAPAIERLRAARAVNFWATWCGSV
jgi:hypothetical protein